MSEIETPAEIVQTESAPVESTLQPLSTLTHEERKEWRNTGLMPKKQDSAPALKDTAVPDSAPETEEQSADTDSDSAPEPPQKPRSKTKEDTERRIRELLEERDHYKRQAEEAKKTAPRETKQTSQPAAEGYKPLDEKDYFKDNPNKTYEDFVRAAARHEAKWEVRQELAAENYRRAEAEARKELTSKIEEAKSRYEDYDQERINSAVNTIVGDQEIANPVKAMLEHSPNFVDLLYVFSEPKALEELVSLAKSNPAAAIRKIVLTEQLVQAELSKGKEDAGTTPPRGEDGKFVSEKKVSAPPITKAPRPPSEVGGRGTASEDSVLAGVKANPGTLTSSTKAAMDRQYMERHK